MDWQLKAHGILMFSSLGIFTTFSVLIARYLDRNKYKFWFDAHLYSQLISHIGTLIGIGFAFFDLNKHLTCIHSWIGLVILICSTFIQPLLGLPDEADGTPKRITLKRHRVLGRIVGCLGFINILLGMKQLDISQKYYIFFGFYAFTILICIITLEYKRYLINSKKKKDS